jgi:hypothetical protein
MKQRATLLLGLLCLASPTFANPTLLLNGGTMDFDYMEVPPGSVNGHFSSNGVIVKAPPIEGTAAATFELDGDFWAVVVGAVEDGANFVDGGVILVKDPDNPIVAGTYDLDGVNGALVFIDNALGWIPPLDFKDTNWSQELADIVADGKHSSVSGSVTFSTFGDFVVAGTFETATFDAATGVELAVTNGTFNVDTTTSVESQSFTQVKALYR